MSVPEQVPYKEYRATGSNNSFEITFYLPDPKDLVVMVNKEIPLVGAYSIQGNTVVFSTPPNEGDLVELTRDTQLDRETEYKSYDNSFRPETINFDLDKIWLVLQESNLVDAKILARLKQEIEWRRTHDFNYDELAQVREKQLFDALKGYTDTLLASTNPGVFQGVIAGVVFARDGKSIQTHLEDILNELVLSREDINKKADKSYVDEQLDLKANAEDVYKKDQTYTRVETAALVNPKADQAYVDMVMANLSTLANKFYPTLAAANADIANIAVNQPVTVGEVNNGGIWYKPTTGATSLSKSPYDPLQQSLSYTDGTTYQDKGRLTTEHIDTLLSRGIWVCNTTANATIANGYPWEGVPCVITNKKTSATPTLLQVAESIEATSKRTATRRHNGTSWGQWNYGEIIQFTQLDSDVKNKLAPKGTWLYPDDTVCTFDKATRILSWNRAITLATRNVTQNRVNFSAGSINLSTAPDYTIIYLDLTLLPTDGSTVTNPASCIKFGTYNQFVDDITKLPLAAMRSATGNVVSKNGFMPIINGSGGGTSSSDGSSTIEFNKTATALEFYVKGGGANMIKHQLVHAVMPDIQLDNWGMTTAMEVDKDKANVKAITSNGVWECALKDSANPTDHSGGSHGDELKTSAFFLVDGVYKAEDFVLSGKAKEIKFVQKSVIYAQESTIKIADRQVEWTFAAEKLNMKQTVTPVAGRTFTSTWVLMLPVLRKSNTDNTGIQITDKEIRSFDWSVIDVSEPDFVRREIVCKKGHIINLSGQTSGISATIKVNEIESPNPMHFVQNNIQFNKIYVAARTINTSALIAEGEKWVIDADVVISTTN